LAVGLYLLPHVFAPAACSLFFSFIAVAAIAVRKQVRVPCNCFGAGSNKNLSVQTIYVNVVLIVFTVFAFFQSIHASRQIISSLSAPGLLLVTLCIAQTMINIRLHRQLQGFGQF